jgi:hypothetical protein
LLLPLRAGYFGSTTFGRRNQPRTVFLESPVRLETSRSDIPSLKCIRLILANILTLITPCSPALFLSEQVNHGGSVLRENYLPKWVSSGWTSTRCDLRARFGEDESADQEARQGLTVGNPYNDSRRNGL